MKKSDLRLFKKIPYLETERLYLSNMTVEDLDDVFEYASDPRLTKYLMWEPHKYKTETLAYLKYIITLYSKTKFYEWGIHLKENGKMIGTCGFTKLEPQLNKGSVGYVLNTGYINNGYATEALTRVIEFGFNTLNLNRLEARFVFANHASRRVLEKCGFTYCGVEKKKMLIKGEYKAIGYSYLIRSNA